MTHRGSVALLAGILSLAPIGMPGEQSASSSPTVVGTSVAPSHLLRDLLIAGIGSALGAVGGALAVFLMERRTRRSDDLDAEALDGTRALTVLADQLNSLHNLNGQHLDKWRDDPLNRWYMLPVIPAVRFLRLATVDLRFLMKSDGPAVAVQATIAERLLDVVNDLIAERREIHLNRLQPNLDRFLSANNQTHLPSAEYMEKHILGERNAAMLKNYTDNLYLYTSDAIVGIEAATGVLREFLTRQYPDKKFFTVEPPARHS